MYPLQFLSNDTIYSLKDKQEVLSVSTEKKFCSTLGFVVDEATTEEKSVFILFQHSYCSEIPSMLIRQLASYKHTAAVNVIYFVFIHHQTRLLHFTTLYVPESHLTCLIYSTHFGCLLQTY